MNSVHLVTQEKYRVEKNGLKTKPGARAPNWSCWHAQVSIGAPSRPPSTPLPRACAPCSVPVRPPARPAPYRTPAAGPARPRAPSASTPVPPSCLRAPRALSCSSTPAPAACARLPSARARPAQRPTHAQPSAPTPAYPSTVSWPAWPYRRRKAACLVGRVLGWLCCITTQPSFSSLSQSQYTFCIATPSFSALKPVSLQYNFLYCNILLSQILPSCNTIPLQLSLLFLQYNFTIAIQFFFSLTIQIGQ